MPSSGSPAHPTLTAELLNTRRRCQTCSQPARLEPSSRKVSCSPRTPPSSMGKRRGGLTRVGGRGVCVPCAAGMPGPATPARTCGGEGQAHPQAGLAGLCGQAQPGTAQRQGGRLQRRPGAGRVAAAGAAQRPVGCRGRADGGRPCAGGPAGSRSPGDWECSEGGEPRGGALGREVPRGSRVLVNREPR